MELRTHNEIKISDDKNLLRVEFVHALLKGAYWCKGIPLETFRAAVNGSLCFGAYIGNVQVAFARVVTDGATFAWLCDVIVDPNYRGRGISKALMKYIMSHSRMKGFRRICLATKDAHTLYEQFNFKITATPEYWMEIKDNDIYLNSKP
ncbi:MAG: GNAT family N-acetyltransferase [Bdellovibrionales bacterium]|nr:GNAT family N-acetyltransferase [Bdellovibrionales bacterium]